jgi:hypothetical protein
MKLRKWMVFGSVGFAILTDQLASAQTSSPANPANRSGASPTVAPVHPRRPVHPAPWQSVVRRPSTRPTISYATALQRYRHESHPRFWWRQHFPIIVFSLGAYYYLDGSYWYPAWGYDPSYNYYDYDGPIYTYGNLLPDQVILNVQRALRDLGYYGGPLSGSLSGATRAAIAAFQRDAGLVVTGVVDGPTVDALGLE